jgi:hypothetical protein
MSAPILPMRRDVADVRPARRFAQLLIDAGVNVPIGADENWLAMEACAQILARTPLKTISKGARSS